jgi:hypothetical protein
MALAPKFAGQKLASNAIQPKAVHTLELCTSSTLLSFPKHMIRISQFL